jgi:uncharacterized protein
MTDAPVRLEDNQPEQRFEIHVGDELAGVAMYDLEPGRITFIHTEIDDAFEGQGCGSKLVRFALDSARERGLQVVARCDFVAGYIREHPEYQDLLAA